MCQILLSALGTKLKIVPPFSLWNINIDNHSTLSGESKAGNCAAYCNQSTGDTKAGGSHVCGQPGLYNEIHSHKTKPQTNQLTKRQTQKGI